MFNPPQFGQLPLNPGAGGPIHGQQFPGPIATGAPIPGTPAPNTQFPLNPAAEPPVAQPGTYYPGAAGAPSGVHPLTPGVQSVSQAISSLPGVLPNFNFGGFGNGIAPAHSAYRDAIQNWQAQRTGGPRQDPAGFAAWRAERPQHADYSGKPVV